MIKENKLNKLYLNDIHIKHNAKFVSFAGYNMPISYDTGIINEHLETRSNIGLFDVSHMLQLNIKYNEYTIDKLQKIIPLNFEDINFGKSRYSFIINQEGGIIDDLIISKIQNKNEKYLYLVLNASRKNEDIKILTNTINRENTIEERKNYCLLALQGPKSRSLLSKIFNNINELNFMEIAEFEYNDRKLIISCSGYTGEDGFEISIHKDSSKNFINQLAELDKIRFCGLGSRDTLRLEAGLCLYGNELSENISPYEANLSWAIPKSIRKDIKFSKLSMIESKKVRVGIISQNNFIPRSNYEIFDDQNKLIGMVTSGSFSPSLKKPIAMGYINKNYININSKIFFKHREKIECAIINKLPFIKHNYKKG